VEEQLRTLREDIAVGLGDILELNFQLRLRCACAATAMRERCDIIAAQSQRTRIADQFPIATAMRRPCDVQPSMYTGCICVSNSKLLFVQTDIYVITCAAGDSVLKTKDINKPKGR
jgi:hypothetical protein